MGKFARYNKTEEVDSKELGDVLDLPDEGESGESADTGEDAGTGEDETSNEGETSEDGISEEGNAHTNEEGEGEGEGESSESTGEGSDVKPEGGDSEAGTGEDSGEGEEAPVTLTKAQYDTLLKTVDNASVPQEVQSVGGAESGETPAGDSAEVDALRQIFEAEDFDFDAIMESKENFVKFMTEYGSAVKEMSRQETLASIPNVVGNYVNQRASLNEAATEFYSQYPELKRVKRFVSKVANEVHAENPDWDLGDVFQETAKRAKETLGLKGEIEAKEKQGAVKPKPKLGGASGGTRQPAKPSKTFQDEINDLIDD